MGVENGLASSWARQWPSLGRHVPEALPILSAEALLASSYYAVSVNARGDYGNGEAADPRRLTLARRPVRNPALAPVTARRGRGPWVTPLSPEMAKTLTTDH